MHRSFKTQLLCGAFGATILFIAFCVFKRQMITRLNDAIIKHDVEQVQINASAVRNRIILSGMNPLEVAIESGNKVAFTLLLKQGADPHSKNKLGLPMLHHTCGLRDSFWVEELLKNKADPNLLWKGDWSHRPRRPMCVAMRSKQFHLVPILVDAGASLSEPIMTDPDCDYSPLGYASDEGPEGVETAIYLLEKGAVPDLSKASSAIGAFKQDGPDAPWRRPITKWFEDQGQDIRNARWDGKLWVIPPFENRSEL
jgi:ankyrin repeat protein